MRREDPILSDSGMGMRLAAPLPFLLDSFVLKLLA